MANATTPVIQINEGNVGIGTTSPTYKLNVVTNAVAGKQNLAAIDRTAQNFITFTNPQYSTDSSVGLLLRVFPQSDARQGAGIIASGGPNNATTDLDLFVTTSPDGAGGTSYSALKINGLSGSVGIGTTSPRAKLDVNGAFYVTGNTGLPNGVAPLAMQFTSPTGRIYVGDGSGYDLRFSKRISSVDTDFVTIKDNGNVGIGTTSASKTLEVAGTGIKLVNAANTHTHLLLDTATYDYKLGDISTSGGAYMQILSSTNQTFIYNSDLILSDGQKITITRSNPADPSCIYVDNTYTSFGTTYNIDSDVSSTLGSRHIGFRYNGTIVGFIGTNGTTAVTYSTTASDERLKKNIEDWQENILDKFEKIEPKEFNFISQEEGEGKTKGFIAQNMVEDFPEAYPHDYSEDKYYSFNPSGMVVYLMKAVKDLVEQNKQLETRIQTLEQQKL